MRHPLLTLVGLVLVMLAGSPPAWSESNELKRVQYGEGALAFAAGFIRPSLPVLGTVSTVTGDNQTTGNRRLLARGDRIYLVLRDPDAVQPGDLLTLYRHVHEVYHPVGRSFLGILFNIVGLVRVVDVTERPVTVEVLRAYNSIFPGDRAMPFEGLPRSAPRDPLMTFDGEGMIIDVPPAHTLIGQGHLVYLDRGADDGLRPGDLLEVFRSSDFMPPRVIGELKVLTVERETAAAVIVRSRFPYIRGDRFRMKRAAPELVMDEGQDEDLMAQTEAGGAEQVASLSAVDLSTDRDAGAVDQETRRVLEGLLDRVVFESGDVTIRPEGKATLNRVSELLKEVEGKQIQIQGHTDNVPIGPSLSGTYPSNWELSQARAREVVRYLVEEAGVSAERLSAVGYADTQPVASNASETGRTKNRRVEIVLFAPRENVPDASAHSAGEPADPVAPSPAPAPATGDADSMSSDYDGAIGDLSTLDGNAVPPPPSELPVDQLPPSEPAAPAAQP